MSFTKRGLLLTIFSAFVLSALLLHLMGKFQRTITDGDENIAFTVESAMEASPVVVLGKVIDNGEPRNLRRDNVDPTKEHPDVVVPGTNYSIEVIEVIKSPFQVSDIIKVAINGGEYKKVKTPIRASFQKNKEYLFTLAPSASGNPQYYGLIEPFVFEFKNNKLVAVNNEVHYKEAFKEKNINKEVFISQFQK